MIRPKISTGFVFDRITRESPYQGSFARRGYHKEYRGQIAVNIRAGILVACASNAMNRTELTQKMKAAAGQVLQSKGYISAVDVLMAIGKLSKENHERWRFRQVPHLEKVLPGSLNQIPVSPQDSTLARPR